MTQTPENKDTAPKPPRNRPPTTQRKLIRASFYAVMTGVCLIVLIAFAQNEWAWIVLGVPAYYFGRASVRHFKTRARADDFSEQDLDGKSPVLFLRPFEQDGGWDGATAFNLYRPSTWRKFPFSPRNLHILYLEMTGRNSFEQVLAYYVRGAGSLVAFGEPGCEPILGAENYYVGDVNWQDEVTDLALRSALVVLTAGTTEGVLWEVETMLRKISPRKFMLNVPGSSKRKRRAAYAAFLSAAAHLFPAGLPEDINGARFLMFDDDWLPITDKIRRPPKNSPAWIAQRITATLV